jgi:crossover junction endodeoxyribonuclease RuvC
MRVLGVDPGLTRCGIGIVDVAANRRATLVYVGVVNTPATMALDQRLLAVSRGIRAALAEHRPTAMAVERVFAQHNLRTVMGTAQKAQVGTMVARVLGLTEIPKPADAADALALAICHAWRGGLGADFDTRPAGVTHAAEDTPALRAWREAERTAARAR